MAHDVFISYSSKDKPTADAVCASLEAKGIRCWIAPRDILPSMDWGEAIINAINHSRLMILIFSSNANGSIQIKREVERAASKEVPILPFRIENVDPSGALEYYLGTPHWLDALTPPLENHINQLVESVQLLLSILPEKKVGDKVEFSSDTNKKTYSQSYSEPEKKAELPEFAPNDLSDGRNPIQYRKSNEISPKFSSLFQNIRKLNFQIGDIDLFSILSIALLVVAIIFLSMSGYLIGETLLYRFWGGTKRIEFNLIIMFITGIGLLIIRKILLILR